MTQQKPGVSQQIKLSALMFCAIGAMFYGYNYLLRIEPSVIVPTLMQFFHTDATHVGKLSAMYYYAYTPMQILVGLILDRFAPRRTLSVAALLSVSGSALFALTTSIHISEIGRFMIGLGSAFAYVGALKIGTIWLHPRHFAIFAGCVSSFGMLCASIGNIVYTRIIDTVGWQNLTFVLSGIGVVLAILIALVLRDQNKDNQINEVCTSSLKETLQGLKITVFNSQIWLSGLIGFAFYLPITVFGELWGNSFLQGVYHFTPQLAAFAVSMTFFGTLTSNPFAGVMAGWFGSNKKALYIGLAGSAVCLIFVIYGTFLPVWAVFALLFTYSFLGGPHILCFSISKESSAPHTAATALAFTNMLIMMGGIIFQPLVGYFLDLGWDGVMSNGARLYPASIYQLAMLVLPFCLLVGVVLTYFLRETFGQVGKNPEETTATVADKKRKTDSDNFQSTMVFSNK
jgi:MFS family permease